MPKICLIAVAVILTASGCQRQDDAKQAAMSPDGAVPLVDTPANADSSPATGRWELQASDEGVALALVSKPDATVIRLFCRAGERQLLVNIPGFKPVGSEERLSFGGQGEVMALVAGPRGDRSRGGVSGVGEVPDNLATLLDGAISVSYGAQESGPHRAAPKATAASFVNACREPLLRKPNACMMQNGTRLLIEPLHAIGTEPFWGARVEGRCVTYNHPEDQQGTRIWTRYVPTADGGRWSGSVGRGVFILTTRHAPGCSDGMSDKKYPIAVDLVVNGEQRKGCAKAL